MQTRSSDCCACRRQRAPRWHCSPLERAGRHRGAVPQRQRPEKPGASSSTSRATTTALPPDRGHCLSVAAIGGITGRVTHRAMAAGEGICAISRRYTSRVRDSAIGAAPAYEQGRSR
ncbi:hypothetical protein Veis_4245 [Verminephrobacter eiseniae EF01-2]|uniref:Uncharacterized protein n=1 Tax=Verminephrobacter eiseniae (strain EF01-2) TaxID=391735 RepID=A1WQP3_VEREI|nr:hypothetical protein Veis_4245 [Verminephrobacter eiseniae EF01-2]